jgi:hypothetical protein
LTIIFIYENLIDFTLKEEYKSCQSVEDKVAEIDSFLSPYILTKQFQLADLKQMSLLCLKCSFYSNVLIFLILKLRNNKLIDSFRKYLGFPEYG